MPKLDSSDFGLEEPPLTSIGKPYEDDRSVEEQVVDRISGTRKWYIDFSCWVVEAKDRHEATLIAEERLKNGERPEISEVMMLE